MDPETYDFKRRAARNPVTNGPDTFLHPKLSPSVTCTFNQPITIFETLMNGISQPRMSRNANLIHSSWPPPRCAWAAASPFLWSLLPAVAFLRLLSRMSWPTLQQPVLQLHVRDSRALLGAMSYNFPLARNTTRARPMPGVFSTQATSRHVLPSPGPRQTCRWSWLQYSRTKSATLCKLVGIPLWPGGIRAQASPLYERLIACPDVF